jgi:predicted nucleic acid-binding protein
MARTYDLTAYDTAYLELAMRLNVPLITYDKSLLNAAKKFKIRTAI